HCSSAERGTTFFRPSARCGSMVKPSTSPHNSRYTCDLEQRSSSAISVAVSIGSTAISYSSRSDMRLRVPSALPDICDRRGSHNQDKATTMLLRRTMHSVDTGAEYLRLCLIK